MRSGDDLEIDLYNELTSFSLLSPEGQEADRKNLNPPPPTPVTVEPTPPSPVYPKEARSSPANHEADSFNLMTIQGGQIVIEQVLLDDLEETASADPNLAEAKRQNQNAEACETKDVGEAPVKAIEEVSTPAAEPVEINAADNTSLEWVDTQRVTGSLSDSSSPAPNSWTALITCPACGNEADSQEMFCVACGGFLDDPQSKANSQMTCADCGSVVESDEVFCHSCGSVLIAE